LEEYVSDCVILLDFRVIEQIATRRLRIIKYRGSTHGTNEYPFLIDEDGISVIPITSLQLDYKSPTTVVSTGLPALDKLFSGNGIYKASSTLITGTAGTAKTILSSYFAMSSCKRKEPVLFFSFEESPDQLIRNMAAVGINFKAQIKSKLLHIYASRPSLQGLEMHLLVMNKLMDKIKPRAVIIDPISSLITIGNSSEVRGMLVRLMDTLKTNEINAVFTSLTHNHTSEFNDVTVDAVSSLADTWIDLDNGQKNNERVRSLLIVKSRGMGHANSKQNFTISNKGIKFLNNSNK
jgi:circadian clock protein KaiC